MIHRPSKHDQWMSLSLCRWWTWVVETHTWHNDHHLTCVIHLAQIFYFSAFGKDAKQTDGEILASTLNALHSCCMYVQAMYWQQGATSFNRLTLACFLQHMELDQCPHIHTLNNQLHLFSVHLSI
jgi:hypothetical protein